MAYEDIDLAIRLSLLSVQVCRAEGAIFFHPPFYFSLPNKYLAMGQALLQMRKYYSWPIWAGLLLNALRFLPYGLVPDTRCQQWFQISWGIVRALFARKAVNYE